VCPTKTQHRFQRCIRVCNVDFTMVVRRTWTSGSTLVSINEVNPRRVPLVLGWVTVSGFNSRCGTCISVCNQPPRQLSLAIPSWVGRSECQLKGGCLAAGEYRQGIWSVCGHWVTGKNCLIPCYTRTVTSIVAVLCDSLLLVIPYL